MSKLQKMVDQLSRPEPQDVIMICDMELETSMMTNLQSREEIIDFVSTVFRTSSITREIFSEAMERAKCLH